MQCEKVFCSQREGVAVRRNPMGVVLIQPYGSRSSHWEKDKQPVFSKLYSKSLSGSTELQTLQSSEQEEKRKEIGKETGMMRRSKVGGTKALPWILLWILIGVRVQVVEADEEEIPARREMDRMLETARVPRVGNMATYRRMESFDEGRRAGEHGREKVKKTKKSQGKDPKTFQRNSLGRDPCTLERNSQGKEQRTFEENIQGGDPSTPETKQPGKRTENL